MESTTINDTDPARTTSLTQSQASQESQTAGDYISSQLRLEADAREALPYQFDTCTKPLGPLKQSVFACLTCTPPPASPLQHFTPAGVCYSCSISCHGEHNLVELFTKRDFVCDCGTTRMENGGTPCSLRVNQDTGLKGGVLGEKARGGNKYNQNFQGKFCGCGEEYDPEKEKGTMFQCLGLGHVREGSCGEDWWHPECLMGVPRVVLEAKSKVETNGAMATVKEEVDEAQPNGTYEEGSGELEELPLPEGFPGEDDFDHLLCYKCVEAFPFMKRYAGTRGVLPAVPLQHTSLAEDANAGANSGAEAVEAPLPVLEKTDSKKRKADDTADDAQDSKKVKTDEGITDSAATTASTNGTSETSAPKHAILPTNPPTAHISLFLKEDFRDHLCRCPECYPLLRPHPQLLEEEDPYEPPLSTSSASEGGQNRIANGSASVHSGSLLERGEAALNNMDRVRAIEGVMAYNHVRDKVREFLKPFAESGDVVSAEEVKAYFARLRGDEGVGERSADGGGGGEGDGRREQEGY